MISSSKRYHFVRRGREMDGNVYTAKMQIRWCYGGTMNHNNNSLHKIYIKKYDEYLMFTRLIIGDILE